VRRLLTSITVMPRRSSGMVITDRCNVVGVEEEQRGLDAPLYVGGYLHAVVAADTPNFVTLRSWASHKCNAC
jgi:hypothetical protein